MMKKYISDEHALWLIDKILERARIDVSYMDDGEYFECMDVLFNSLDYQKIDPSLFTGEKMMDKHLDIGDQFAQTASISYPIPIDNYIKIVKGTKLFSRYMDDSYAIHESKSYLEDLLADMIIKCNDFGITVNVHKTRIVPLDSYWRFLQVQYSLTDTGRIIKKIHPKRLAAMRSKMKKRAPYMLLKEYLDWYNAWFQSYYKIMSRKQRENMDTLRDQLKEECLDVHNKVS